jgi:hypothetical protein
MYHKRLNWQFIFSRGSMAMIFLPEGKRSHFTPYNQGMKLLIITELVQNSNLLFIIQVL